MSHIRTAVESSRATRDAIATEILAEIRHLNQTQTVWVERLAGQVVNHVLEVATVAIPDDGWVTRSYHVPAGSIEVSNPGLDDVTVVAGSPATSVPAVGVGVFIVPGGTLRHVNLASHAVTIYGTAAAVVSFQVLTTPACGGRGGLAQINGGTP